MAFDLPSVKFLSMHLHDYILHVSILRLKLTKTTYGKYFLNKEKMYQKGVRYSSITKSLYP